MNLSFQLILACSGLHHLIAADLAWPEYNQQCRDDAGPPYLDDDETYGNGKYHDGSSAYPILDSNGECAEPIKDACTTRPNKRTAYLEGPISCGGQGWYCRIMEDPNWDNIALKGDFNFGHCNTTENFDDGGRDGDGHCHGSASDETYYWWVRDHWFRQYNGRLRCCCGWDENSSSTPLYSGRIANRCDYRRLVTETEDILKCRDANEDHGLGFDGIGCNSDYEDQIGKPIPEDDAICWEVAKFGYSEDDDSGPDLTVHVNDVEVSSKSKSKNKWIPQLKMYVYDSDGTPRKGVTATAKITIGSQKKKKNCKSKDDGKCLVKFPAVSKKNSSVKVSLQKLAWKEGEYDKSMNGSYENCSVVFSGSCNSISIEKP